MPSAANERQSSGTSTSGRPMPTANGHGLHRSPSKQALLPTRQQLVWSKAEALAWLCASGFVIWFGNGSRGTIDIVMHDSRVKRPWFYVGLGFLGVDFLTFLYLSIWVKRVKQASKDDAKAAPTVVTTETLSTTAAGIMFTVAFWSIWRLFTPIVLVVLFMGFTMLSQFRPSTWAYRRAKQKK